MKKLACLFIVFVAFYSIKVEALLASSDSETERQQKFRVLCHNEDIGPVRGGRFLEDQQFLVNGNIYGKSPGSGLFNIPVCKNHTFEDCYPLFTIFPHIKVILKGGEMVESMQLAKTFRDPNCFEDSCRHALGLPGTTKSIEMDLDPSSILCLTVQLYTWKYSFTTGGGELWFRKGCVPTAISPAVTYMPEGTLDKIRATFSWPSAGPYKGENKIDPEVVGIKFRSYDIATVGREDLDPDWKNTLGMHTDNNNSRTAPWCYPTRDFNRGGFGDDPCIDLLKIGEDFPFYAGHPLEVRP